MTAARCAARIWPSVHGSCRQSGPQVALRRPITGPGEAVTAGGGLAGGAVGHPGQQRVVHAVGEHRGLARGEGDQVLRTGRR